MAISNSIQHEWIPPWNNDSAAWDVRRGMSSIDYSEAKYSTFSGADISCSIYIPPEKAKGLSQYVKDPYDTATGAFLFADLQTLSISSARSINPVRTLGRAEPTDYTRGARTIAGSLIFTDIRRDAFANIMSIYRMETTNKYDFFVDQVPPFNIIISAVNEAGVNATRALVGVTLANYGTTYSIDDLMTESQYSFVAMGLTPFMPKGVWRTKMREIIGPYQTQLRGKSASSLQAPIPSRALERGNKGYV